jgi:hypothetical protein
VWVTKVVEPGTLPFPSMGNACFPEYLTKPFIDCLCTALVAVTLYKEIAFRIFYYVQRIPVLPAYLCQRVRERNHPLLSVLALPYDQIPVIKVYVLHFQGDRFANADSGSVQHA